MLRRPFIQHATAGPWVSHGLVIWRNVFFSAHAWPAVYLLAEDIPVPHASQISFALATDDVMLFQGKRYTSENKLLRVSTAA